jgi:hypothetical protein
MSDDLQNHEDDYADETLSLQNDLLDSYGEYEVVRSADPALGGWCLSRHVPGR